MNLIEFKEEYINNLFHLPTMENFISYFEVRINSFPTYISIFKIKTQLFIRIWDTDLENLVQGFDLDLIDKIYILNKQYNYNNEYYILISDFLLKNCQNNYFLNKLIK